MTLALNLLVVAILIAAAGLGGYALSQIKQASNAELRTQAYRTQIARLRRALAKSEDDAKRFSDDLDRSRRRVRRYEMALYSRSMEQQPSGDPVLASAPPQQAPSGQFDREVLENVEKTVDVDRFGVNVVRREIA